jgi:hypothetical protein
MYSNSNNYLGGANNQRPSVPQYGIPYSLAPGQQPSQQQPSPFAPQPTGYAQTPPIQQQYTGFPLQNQQTGMQQAPQQLQTQYTGFPGQGSVQQGFPSSAPAPPMPSIPAQYQQQYQQQQQQQQHQPTSQMTGFTAPPQISLSSHSPTPAASTQKPQPTGFSQMAASFQTGGPKVQTQQPPRKTNKIPNIRLSFIAAQDQDKFENLFKTSAGDGQTTISGEKARDILLRSKLDGDSLSHIWYCSLTLF